MVELKGGEKFSFELYLVKEYHEKKVVKPDGTEDKFYSVDTKFLVNPKPQEINKPNVEVIVKRDIIFEIREVNQVGKIPELKSYLIGCRIVDGRYRSPVFHIRVRNDQELREKILKEVKYYLKTRYGFNMRW